MAEWWDLSDTDGMGPDDLRAHGASLAIDAARMYHEIGQSQRSSDAVELAREMIGRIEGADMREALSKDLQRLMKRVRRVMAQEA